MSLSSDVDVACHSATEPIEAATLAAAFHRTVQKSPSKLALRTIGGDTELTWRQLLEEVRTVSAGLAAIGVGRGDHVAMLLRNTIENHVTDCALTQLGAVPFGIFNSSSPEQIAYQVGHAEARLIITERRFLEQVRTAMASMEPSPADVVVVDGGAGDLTLVEVKNGGDPAFDLEACRRAIDAEDIACIIFTSGTTGQPKAAQWSNRMIMACLRATQRAIPIPERGLVSYLPLAAAAGRINGMHYAVVNGATLTVCPENADLANALADAHPDMFTSSPRWFDKLRVAIEKMVAAEPDAVRERMTAAINAGIARSQAEETHAARSAICTHDAGDVPGLFKPILSRLGLDELKVVIIGGASVPPGLLHFFRAIGIPLLEAYGATEISICVYNRIHDFKTGAAGKPLPGVELQLAEDGEILIRSDFTMSGYFKDPERTREVIGADRWIRTGDIGVIDDDGFLSIVDRKKDIIINSHGKNMAPSLIESTIMEESPLISQLVVIGEARRYVTGLITVEPHALGEFVAEHPRLSAYPRDAVLDSRELKDAIQCAVDRGNARLNRNEQLKKFAILQNAWEPDSDELTPTGKVKRRIISQKYADVIDSLYGDQEG